MVTGFFPRDNQLGLLPGALTPQCQGWLIRLSVWMPFAPAAALFAEMTGTPVSAATAHRLTIQAGQTGCALQAQETAVLAQTMPLPTATPSTQVLSVDGAMVPLRGGDWGEVKTLAVGELTTQPQPDGTISSKTQAISYFSRLTDATTFTEAARWEIHRRGVERATRVVAVNDGAEWIQGFLDHHCPSAVRILDFPHASQRLTTISEACFGVGHADAQTWQAEQRRVLKTEGGRAVLATIRALQGRLPDPSVVAEDLGYLAKREAQLNYAAFQAQGLPIGSGMVESANKLVVEARLKGSGMHWEREYVNGMLCLRNAVCSDRWAEQWRAIAQAQQRAGCGARRRRPPRQRGRRDRPRLELTECLTTGTMPADGRVAAAIAQVQAELANERANSVWRKPWSRKQQRVEADARVAH